MIPVYSILRKTQKELHTYLYKQLSEYYTDITSADNYLLAKGDIPILLVAHLDTVYPEITRPHMQIYYDQKHMVMWSPDGIGADDRAGVIIILRILAAGYRPHVLFTHDEEFGGNGAFDASMDPQLLQWDIRYMIQLDRSGYDDCVFYSCNNLEFTHYIESFGFTEDIGSFSDISILMPYTNIAGVNLSVGYEDEHIETEHWHLGWANETYSKVIAMLSAPPEQVFKYIKGPGGYYWDSWINDYTSNEFNEYSHTPATKL